MAVFRSKGGNNCKIKTIIVELDICNRTDKKKCSKALSTLPKTLVFCHLLHIEDKCTQNNHCSKVGTSDYLLLDLKLNNHLTAVL